MLVETIRHERIVSVAAGRAHSVALAADGKIFTWGDASKGQLGHAQLAAMMQVGMGRVGQAVGGVGCSQHIAAASLGIACASPAAESSASSPPPPLRRAPTRSRCPSPSRKPFCRWSP